MSQFCIWDAQLKKKFEGLILERDDKNEAGEVAEVSLPQENSFFCRTCEVQLDSRTAQVDHYRSEEHRKKIKSKLRTRKDSESDSNSDDDEVELDSSSDWSGDEEIATSANLDAADEKWKGRPPQEVHFWNDRSEKISAFRAMVASRAEMLNEFDILSRLLRTRQEFVDKVDGDRYDAVLLFAAGAFAGCIFVNGEPTVHRVIKKYVVRAKRGTAQSTRDNKNATKPSSMGAQLRRQNEKDLCEKISAQVVAWGGDLEKCKTVFVRAPKHQKSVLLQPLKQIVRDKNRIRPVPCPMHKPRFQETVRMFQKIFSVKVRAESELPQVQTVKSPTKAQKPPESPKVAKKVTKSESETEICDAETVEIEEIVSSTSHLKVHEATKRPKRKKPKNPNSKQNGNESLRAEEDAKNATKSLVDELFTQVKANKAAALDEILQKVRKDKKIEIEHVLNLPIDSENKTLLHIASQCDAVNIIHVLLANGADPERRTVGNVVPFRLCSVREARAAFWEFRRSHPDKYNWAKAEVPDPATIKENPTARKRPKRKKKPEEKKEPEKEIKPEIKNPCDECGQEIANIPFKYSDFNFCATRCLRAHRFAAKS